MRAEWTTAIGLVFLAPGLVSAEQTFKPADIIEWESHSFEGETDYELVEMDDREAIHAVCEEGTASGLFLREEIDLTEAPVIEWEWRVDHTFSAGVDETTKAGDDYPARLYAVTEHSIARWRTRAINYVWASEQEQGASWENAYQSRAQMIAVQSGVSDQAGEWRTQRRNLQDDFRKIHDRELESISAIAIMTDCDDVGEPVEAWYGAIRLLPE